MTQAVVGNYLSDEYVTHRQRLDRQRSELENERSSFDSHWRDLSRFILPRRSRFSSFDTNEGGNKYRNIINSTGTRAARELSSGMMSHVTNPARNWFRLAIRSKNDEELDEEAKQWLHDRTKDMFDIFSRSNLYDVLPIMYSDIGVFGTCCFIVERDDEDVVRFTSLPIGSYLVGNDSKDRVRVFIREFRLSIRQAVERFAVKVNGKLDISMFSQSIQNYWINGNREQWIDICHHIYPNSDYDMTNKLSTRKKYRSVYYEKSDTVNNAQDMQYQTNRFLSDSGFDDFPVLVGRWAKRSEDVYGIDCPGMLALGDIRSLQIMEKRKAELVAKITNPPMIANANIVSQKTTLLPGDITYATGNNLKDAFSPAIDIRHGTSDIREDIKEHEERIKSSFYEDLFLMLAHSDRREITAREIDERHEEKLSALGTALERVNKDLLEPLIDLTFKRMISSGYIPEPPESIQGEDIKIEYESIMAQAQKLIGLGSMERAAGFYGEMASLNPDILDTYNIDELMKLYGEMVSLPPGIVRSNEDIDNIRQKRAQALEEERSAAMATEGAKAAKDLSQAEVGDSNLLGQLAQQDENVLQGAI